MDCRQGQTTGQNCFGSEMHIQNSEEINKLTAPQTIANFFRISLLSLRVPSG
jgi:hypothetical protein